MHTDKQTPLHAEYLGIMQEVCRPDPSAFRWFVQALDAAMLWDHVVDSDPVDIAKAHETFTALTQEWILNDWFHKNRATLVPILNGCVSAWKASVPGSVESYLPYTALPSAICLLIGGQSCVDRFMPRIHELVRRERWEDIRRDHQPFFIVGLPRSRTAWLAAFLTNGDVTCYHEALRMCDKPGDLAGRLNGCPTPIVGDADPSLPLFYVALRPTLPAHKVVFIIRDSVDCHASMRRVESEAGVVSNLDAWIKVEHAFTEMRRGCPDAMCFQYDDLSKPDTMKQLSEYCTGLPFDAERFRLFDEMKITAITSKVLANQRILP